MNERLYKLLLFLYPARFRDNYSRELQRQFRDEAAETPVPVLWRRTVLDVCRSAPQQHWEELVSDIRHSIRTFLNNPGFTAMVVLTLALGIGANALVFSVLNTFLLQPPVFPEPHRLVQIWEEHRGTHNIVSAPNARDWTQHSHVFTGMGIYEAQSFNISGGTEPQQVNGLRMSAELFRVLGVAPARGRTFTSDDERNVVVVSHDLWRNNPVPVLRINGEPHTVIGVMPPHFRFPYSTTKIWKPLQLHPIDHNRGAHSFHAIARLRPEISAEQARRDLKVTADLLRAEHKEDGDHTATLVPLADTDVAEYRLTFYALLGAVSLLLLMAAANVANLLLARNSARSREFAVRGALGATPWRVVRQLITESLLLAGLGCIAGLALCYAGAKAVPALLPLNAFAYLPYRDVNAIVVDGRVLAFAAACALAAAVLCSIAPAWQMLQQRRSPVMAGNKGAVGPSGARVRSALVAAEVALCLIVLTGAGLMVATLRRLLDVDPGFRIDRVVTMAVSLPQKNPYGKPERVQFCREVAEQSVAGVASISAISHTPLVGGSASRSIDIEGRGSAPNEDDRPSAQYHIVCPKLFSTLGIPVLQGREFRPDDALGAPLVVMVNESMAKRYWPVSNPVGARIRIAGNGTEWLRVVGVVRDIKHFGLAREPRETMYLPYSQAAWPQMTIVASTHMDPAAAAPGIVAALRRLFPDQPVRAVRTMEDLHSLSVGPRRFPMMLLSIFSMLGLSLAAIGIYGVISYSVAQRTQELGVRIALGASRRAILTNVAVRSLRPVLAGVLVGVAGALASARMLDSLLFGVRSNDPVVIAAAVAVLVGAAVLAILGPASHACRVDPISALRYG
jgi:putative ABC transport system permease protein